MKTNFMHPVIAVAALFAIAGPLSRSRAAEPEVMTMRNSNLKLTVGAHVLTAALEDNASSRDFVSLLPLTLTLRDLCIDGKDQRSAQATLHARRA